MFLRALKHPAFLASLAVHGVALGAGVYFGLGAAPVSRPAVLIGLERCEVTGAIDLDAPPPPPPVPDPAIDPLPDPTIEMAAPEEVDVAPVEDAPPVAPSAPSFLEVAPVGLRRVAKASPSPTAPPVERARPAPVARPVATAAPSRRGSFTESRPATLLGNSAPPYPAEALRRRWEGTTVLDVRVTAEGTVASATVYSSSGYAVLDDAAVAACLGYRYLPRLVDGVPAPDWLRQPFTWSMQQP